MQGQEIDVFDKVSIDGDAGLWTVVGTRSLEPKYQVQLGNNAATIKYVTSDTVTLVKKAEKTDSGPGFYPDRSIMG